MVVVLDIKANIEVIKNNIKKVVQDAIKKVDTGVGGAARGATRGAARGELAKSARTSATASAGIFKLLKAAGIVGLLTTVRPFVDAMTFIVSLLVFFFFKGVKFFNFVNEKLGGILTPLSFISDFIGAIDWEELLNKIKDLPSRLWEFIKNLPSLIWGFIKALPKMIWDLVKTVANIIWDLFSAVFPELSEKLVKIKDFIVRWSSKIFGVINGKVITWLRNVWSKIVSVWDRLKELKDSVVSWLINVWNKVTDVWTAINALPSRIWDFMKRLPAMIGSFISNAIGGITRFFGFQHGGIVTRPTAGVVGEAGPEAVIPLDRLNEVLGGRGGGGGNTFNFFGVTSQEMIDTIKRELGVDIIRSGRF